MLPDAPMHALQTPRLRLRPLTLADAPFMVELLNEPSFLRFIGDRGVRTTADAEAFLARGPFASYARWDHGAYLVEHAAPPAGRRPGPLAPLGICGLYRRDTLDAPDLGFALRPAFWGQGYAREAAEAVLADGRGRLGMRRIVAITDLDNTASIGLLERLGLAYVRDIDHAGERLRLHAWLADPGPDPT
jgi:RimJ/RimL family protein N-acetyltransferase